MKLQELLEARKPRKSELDSWSNTDKLQYIKGDGLRISEFTNPTEEMWIEAVKQYSYLIKDNPTPTEKVQLASVNTSARSIKYIKNPTTNVLKIALTDRFYITNSTEEYIDFVKTYFKNNHLLMNKWLRYAQNIIDIG